MKTVQKVNIQHFCHNRNHAFAEDLDETSWHIHSPNKRMYWLTGNTVEWRSWTYPARIGYRLCCIELAQFYQQVSWQFIWDFKLTINLLALSKVACYNWPEIFYRFYYDKKKYLIRNRMCLYLEYHNLHVQSFPWFDVFVPSLRLLSGSCKFNAFQSFLSVGKKTRKGGGDTSDSPE